MKLTREGEIALLEVSDDGSGLPPGYGPDSDDGLGLVSLLARQIGGRFSHASEHGALFTLRFPAP